jgi:hypothetical protein
MFWRGGFRGPLDGLWGRADAALVGIDRPRFAAITSNCVFQLLSGSEKERTKRRLPLTGGAASLKPAQGVPIEAISKELGMPWRTVRRRMRGATWWCTARTGFALEARADSMDLPGDARDRRYDLPSCGVK